MKQKTKLDLELEKLSNDLLLALIIHGEDNKDNSGLLNKLMGELYKR